MTRIPIYMIRELAIRTGRSVYSTQQLANLIGTSIESARVYASRLVNVGLATRLQFGKFSFTDDDFVIASQMIDQAYISLLSALQIHNLTQQIPAEIECVTTRNTLHYS